MPQHVVEDLGLKRIQVVQHRQVPRLNRQVLVVVAALLRVVGLTLWLLLEKILNVKYKTLISTRQAQLPKTVVTRLPPPRGDGPFLTVLNVHQVRTREPRLGRS